MYHLRFNSKSPPLSPNVVWGGPRAYVPKTPIKLESPRVAPQTLNLSLRSPLQSPSPSPVKLFHTPRPRQRKHSLQYLQQRVIDFQMCVDDKLKQTDTYKKIIKIEDNILELENKKLDLQKLLSKEKEIIEEECSEERELRDQENFEEYTKGIFKSPSPTKRNSPSTLTKKSKISHSNINSGNNNSHSHKKHTAHINPISHIEHNEGNEGNQGNEGINDNQNNQGNQDNFNWDEVGEWDPEMATPPRTRSKSSKKNEIKKLTKRQKSRKQQSKKRRLHKLKIS